MCRTTWRRPAHSASGGMSNWTPALRSCCLARLMRLAMVASGTRNARAISDVVSPPTARGVSASWEGTGSMGWAAHQQQGEGVVLTGGRRLVAQFQAATVFSRRPRALTLRHSSTTAQLAAVTSHDRGLLGMPSLVQC
jgi:hypothetical protein